MRWAVLFLVWLPVFAAEPPADPVSPAALGETIGLLAHPALCGREAGTSQADFSARYLAARFRELGLKPWEGEGWLRPFPAVVVSADLSGSELLLEERGKQAALKHGQEVWFELPGLPLPESAKPRELVFAGFGIRAPEFGHDDYAGLDLQGKAVLVWAGEPAGQEGRSPFGQGKVSRHGLVSTKLEAARRAGAALLLIAAPPGGKPVAEGYLRNLRDKLRPVWVAPDAAPLPPVVFVEEKLVTGWFAGSGLDPARLFAEAAPGRMVGAALGGLKAGVRWKDLNIEQVAQFNVAGVLPGSRPEAAPVVLSAHYDHIGCDRNGDGSLTVYPGADDNASGVAALIEAASALASAPPLPRPVLFVVFGAEEKGALGSRAFVEAALAAGKRFQAVVNLDMVGRDNLDREDYRRVVMASYTARAAEWAGLLSGAAEKAGLEVRKLPYLRPPGRSDDTAFAEKEIPAAMLFTGPHKDYNTPDDTPERIRLEKAAAVARMALELVCGLAGLSGPLGWDKEMKTAPPSDPWDRPY